MEPTIMKEKEILNLFKISLILKGVNAVVEAIGGIVIWFTSKAVLVTFILNILQNELSDDPKDFVANFIVNSAEALSVGSQYVIGAYLFLHGFVKIFLLICLFKKKLWAYPLSIFIFTLIVVYEMYVYFVHPSVWTLSMIILDLLVIVLAIHEYNILKRRHKS